VRERDSVFESVVVGSRHDGKKAEDGSVRDRDSVCESVADKNRHDLKEIRRCVCVCERESVCESVYLKVCEREAGKKEGKEKARVCERARVDVKD